MRQGLWRAAVAPPPMGFTAARVGDYTDTLWRCPPRCLAILPIEAWRLRGTHHVQAFA